MFLEVPIAGAMRRPGAGLTAAENTGTTPLEAELAAQRGKKSEAESLSCGAG